MSAGIAGRTDFGFRPPLRGRYRPGPDVVVELGALLGQSYGDDRSLDWRVRETAERPEEFDLGTSSTLRLIGEWLWLDAHLYWSHVGSQENDTRRVEHDLSMMGGLWYGRAGNGEPGTDTGLRFHGSWLSGRGFRTLLGDPLYSLQDSGQLGTAVVIPGGGGLNFEAAVTAQYTADESTTPTT